MDLYLMQHGEARPEQEDPSRPLTELGREEVERVARAAARLGLRIPAIWHSGKLRARQTAEILAQRLLPSPEVSSMIGLAPNDDPAPCARAVEEVAGPVAVVGHLPHLNRLASLLLVGDPARNLVAFRRAGFVYLTREAEGWRLRWILTPELLPSLDPL
jgi:phosphohistidine phosphatase